MSQVQRKFIADNANNGAKIRLDNGETLRARISMAFGQLHINALIHR